jgi:hypothetical protein
MSLHLDVVCEPHVSLEERRSQSICVMAEVLPFVLAKYGVSATNGRGSVDRADDSGSAGRLGGTAGRFKQR